ncbi:pyridoxal phosphate-dependent transferase [Zopfochytrium polystomum]|nr:pyridoxal phosphate-dependent transferase [Zopfochytrium polystomum]
MVLSGSQLHLIKSLVFYLVLLRAGTSLARTILRKGPVQAVKDLIAETLQTVISASRSAIPGANSLVKAEIEKSVKGLQASIIKDSRGENARLPAKGLSDDVVRAELKRHHQLGDIHWESGKVSGAVYYGGDQLGALITESYGLFSLSNPLHPELFPGVRKMEAEIISMVLAMYNGKSEAAGSMTSGGTESILMSVKTHRDWAAATKGITKPEMVVPVTIHAAFNKAAHYFGVKIIPIPIDPKSGEVDLAAVKRAITSNTIMLAGSAPNFPHGIMDNIPSLGALAKKHKIGLHVDACLGGFIIPFAEKAGFPQAYPFDFRVDGVTAISCDTHKYGFAPKGSSVIMYHTKELRKYQYFVAPNWPGGVYASPTVSGSRAGALIAGCWTALMKFGEEGYIETTREIVTAARKIKSGINSIDGLAIFGNPLGSVISFVSTGSVKIFAVGDLLSKKGWHLNMLQRPEAIHISCTYLTVPVADQLVEDAKEAVELLKRDPSLGEGEFTAIYGTAASIPDRSVLVDVSHGLLDSFTMM